LGFLAPSAPSVPALPATPPAAAPATMANTGVAMTAANQRKKALAAASVSAGSSSADLAATPNTAKNNLLGP
jgi:hypothetical protein